MATIPSNFAVKKDRILESLAVPGDAYRDASPKGSVDEGIKSLIADINSMEGIVTTSSCAGRLSVFLEGSKVHRSERSEGIHEQNVSQSAVPGGKGLGGRWLYVSHDPVTVPEARGTEDDHFTKLFGLPTSKGRMTPNDSDGSYFARQFHKPLLETPVAGDIKKIRLVKFQFEPMVSLWRRRRYSSPSELNE
jgi:tRNA wybutosine-synthesizing protein 3